VNSEGDGRETNPRTQCTESFHPECRPRGLGTVGDRCSKPRGSSGCSWKVL